MSADIIGQLITVICYAEQLKNQPRLSIGYTYTPYKGIKKFLHKKIKTIKNTPHFLTLYVPK